MSTEDDRSRRDFGAATAKYIDAFFQNVNWESVAARLERVGAARG